MPEHALGEIVKDAGVGDGEAELHSLKSIRRMKMLS
jgi:hypothetical protein